MKDLNKIIDYICEHIPDFFEIQLCLESGAAYVTLTDEKGHYCRLPDTTDKSIAEQLLDALDEAIDLRNRHERDKW